MPWFLPHLDLLNIFSCFLCLMMMTTAMTRNKAPSTASAIPMASTTNTLALLVESSSGKSAFTYLAQLAPNLQDDLGQLAGCPHSCMSDEILVFNVVA